jgi:hypothetical protein
VTVKRRRAIWAAAILAAATLAAALSLAAAGCAHQYLDPRIYGQVREPIPDHTPHTVQIRYLAVGGFIIQRGDDVVMTAPFYTNPPEHFLLGLSQASPNTTLINSQLHEKWAAKTTAILVGHTHYDHFMDVPLIAKNIAPNAVLYGSETMKQLAMAPPHPVDPTKIVVVTDVGGHDRVDYRRCGVGPPEGCHHGPDSGDWIKLSEGVRIRALCSRHAAPRIAKGCLTSVPAEPRRVGDWKLGDTYAYLIDFLDAAGNPDFRVYYQDTATSPTYGYVSDDLVRDKKVDVALLCAAGFDWVKDNPAGIMRNTKPRYVIYGHWESFFKPLPERPLESLPYFDYSRLVALMGDLARPEPTGFSWPGEFWFAAPGNLFVFEPEA